MYVINLVFVVLIPRSSVFLYGPWSQSLWHPPCITATVKSFPSFSWCDQALEPTLPIFLLTVPQENQIQTPVHLQSISAVCVFIDSVNWNFTARQKVYVLENKILLSVILPAACTFSFKGTEWENGQIATSDQIICGRIAKAKEPEKQLGSGLLKAEL